MFLFDTSLLSFITDIASDSSNYSHTLALHNKNFCLIVPYMVRTILNVIFTIWSLQCLKVHSNPLNMLLQIIGCTNAGHNVLWGDHLN